MSGNFIRRLGVERARTQSVGTEPFAKPAPRVHVCMPVERKALLPVCADSPQSQIADTQPQGEFASERIGGEAVEGIVPAEVGVAVIRPRRYECARCSRQPLHRMMCLEPRL